MRRPLIATSPTHPAIARLGRLAHLDAAAEGALLAAATSRRQHVGARRELVGEGKAVPPARLILSGWAARVRILPDGRRQFISFLLPGDLIGDCRQQRPLATSTIVALTDLSAAVAPEAGVSPHLGEAYAMSQALEEAYLCNQIARLGRMSAQERIIDLLLELHERLALADLTTGSSFEMPLTQEMLGDALGLTSVHVNRMVQLLRKEGTLQWLSGRVTLSNPAILAGKMGRQQTRVSER